MRALFGDSRHRSGDRDQVTTWGYALLFQRLDIPGKPGLFEDLYVRPSARGQGIGRKLLEHLASITQRGGAVRCRFSPGTSRR